MNDTPYIAPEKVRAFYNEDAPHTLYFKIDNAAQQAFLPIHHALMEQAAGHHVTTLHAEFFNKPFFDQLSATVELSKPDCDNFTAFHNECTKQMMASHPLMPKQETEFFYSLTHYLLSEDNAYRGHVRKMFEMLDLQLLPPEQVIAETPGFLATLQSKARARYA